MDIVILQHIAKFLPVNDIKSLMILSKSSNRLANSETLFEFLFQRDFILYTGNFQFVPLLQGKSINK